MYLYFRRIKEYVIVHHEQAVKSHTLIEQYGLKCMKNQSVDYFYIFSEMKSLKYSPLVLKISELNSIKKNHEIHDFFEANSR